MVAFGLWSALGRPGIAPRAVMPAHTAATIGARPRHTLFRRARPDQE